MTTKGYFYVKMYSCYVHINVCDNILRSINSYLKRWNEKPLLIEPDAYCVSGSGKHESHYYLFFNRKTIGVNAINHEKSHLVDFILQDREIATHDEPRAYFDGFVSEKLDAFFKRHKIKIK